MRQEKARKVVCCPLCFVFVKMGSTSWRDNILQALLIGLVVQIVAYALCVFWASLWASWKERMARPATARFTGESMVASDLEMGTVNVGEGTTILGVGDDGKLEDTEDAADTRASTPEIPSVGHLRKAQRKNATEDVKRRASVPVVVDASHPHQVGEVLARKEA